MNSRHRLLNACQRLPVDRPPLWIMRQAGRALPEYRALRERHSFWDLMTTPELAAEVTLQPVRRFPLDAAIVFSDILTVPAALGMEVAFSPQLALTPVVRDAGDIDKLQTAGALKRLDYVGRALSAVRAGAGPELAVLGFAGAPYTIASYMVEGGSSKSYHKIKGLMFSAPAVFDRLAALIADLTADYLEMQLDNGADAVQLFDSWAGELSPPDFRRFALPPVQRIVERIAKRAPVIYFINGVGNLLADAAASGASVLGIDWRLELAEARRRLGDGLALQGNLDPALLFAPAAEITRRTHELLAATGGRGHIMNLGHGLLPETPLTGIQTFIEANAQWAETSTHAA
jgi:uroporphyrinogen decarboxylase